MYGPSDHRVVYPGVRGGSLCIPIPTYATNKSDYQIMPSETKTNTVTIPEDVQLLNGNQVCHVIHSEQHNSRAPIL